MRKLIEFFPELLEAPQDERWALADFADEYGSSVKVLKVVASRDRLHAPPMLQALATGTKKVIHLRTPVGPGERIDRQRASELVEDVAAASDIAAMAGVDLPDNFWRLPPNAVANELDSYDTAVLRKAQQRLKDVIYNAQRFNVPETLAKASKLQAGLSLALQRKETSDEAYRPPTAKTMAATHQRAVARRANKPLRPKPNPEVGK